MSAELFSLIAFFIGLPLIIAGWIWSITVGKKVSNAWMAANIFYLPVFAFALIHWQEAKKPFWLFLIGNFLFIALLFITPEA